ncbi:MAG: SIS domain-containing protein [Chitinophagales bacterium]|nr:SIS domain-containing protein [Chitinophagales bacterium]
MGRQTTGTLERAQEILLLESEAVKNIPLDASLVKAVDLLLSCKGKVVTSGMGKAGIIAQKISSTFSSTGTSSVFLHPGEAQHGDLGMLGKDDVLMVLTNSGRTREIIELVDLAENMLGSKLPIIAITSHPESILKEKVDALLYMGQFSEACSLGMAPTTSTTVMLALGDVLCMLVMEAKGFSKEDFARRHHGGYLGEQSRRNG